MMPRPLLPLESRIPGQEPGERTILDQQPEEPPDDVLQGSTRSDLGGDRLGEGRVGELVQVSAEDGAVDSRLVPVVGVDQRLVHPGTRGNLVHARAGEPLLGEHQRCRIEEHLPRRGCVSRARSLSMPCHLGII